MEITALDIVDKAIEYAEVRDMAKWVLDVLENKGMIYQKNNLEE